jgi:hypothetical protein
MVIETKLPAKCPYFAPVLEGIELAVNTQNGGVGVADAFPPTTSKNAS